MKIRCRIKEMNVVCLEKRKIAHSFPSCKQDQAHAPVTDHRVSSFHFNVLFMCVQMCATGEVVCPSTCGVPTCQNLRINNFLYPKPNTLICFHYFSLFSLLRVVRFTRFGFVGNLHFQECNRGEYVYSK